MFSRFLSKITVHGNRGHEHSFKERDDWFTKKDRIENGYKIAMSDFDISAKVLNLGKNNHQKNIPKMCQEKFEFSKSRDTWDRTLVDENMCKMSIWYLEKRLSFDILNAQKGNFLRYLRGFRHFSEYHILSDLGSSKSVLGSFPVFLTKICPKNMHHTVQTHNYTFDLFSISWPWMTLIWHKVTKDLGGYLEVSQIRSMSFYRLYFNLIRLLCPAKPTIPDC